MAANNKMLDRSLAVTYVKRMEGLVQDYELVKAGQHPQYRFVAEFYRVHRLKRQNFIKFYNRFVENDRDPSALLPQKRGRKFSGVMADPAIKAEIVRLRESGMGRYDIYQMMLPTYGSITPSPSTIYNILKANGLNRLIKQNKELKQRYVREKVGELVHIDCHYLPQGLIQNQKPKDRLFLVGMIDDHSRVVWVDVVDNIRSLTVSYSTQKLLSALNQNFGITAKEILSDNGPEFGSGPHAKNETTSPYKTMMAFLNIKTRYTRPGRPQTNGKIERFWQTIETELLHEQVYKNREELEEQILAYIIYYNLVRPHQGINNFTPYKQMIKNYKQQENQETGTD